MSAYLVDDHTTVAIAYTLVTEAKAGFAHMNPAELACELRCLNLAGLDALYGDAFDGWHVEDTIPDQLEDKPLLLTDEELQKEIRTLTYQCGEHLVTDTPLFRRLCELCGTDDNWSRDHDRDWRRFQMFRQPVEEPEDKSAKVIPFPVQYDLSLSFS